MIVFRSVHDNLVNKLATRIDRTRADIKKLAANPGSSQAAGSTSLRKEDFPGIKHWTGDDFSARRHGKGSAPDDDNDDNKGPTSCTYMEDEHGKLLSIGTRTAVARDAKAFWQAKHNKGVHLKSLSKVDWDIRQEFREAMGTEHPWLRYCSDHWKTDQIWRDKFSKWKPIPVQGGSHDASQLKTLKREHPVDEEQAEPSSKCSKTGAPANRDRAKPTKKVESPISHS